MTWPSIAIRKGAFAYLIAFPGMRLVSLANSRTHWAAKAKLAKSQRRTGKLQTLAAVSPEKRAPGRWHVSITRYGVQKLDSDNLAISAKHLRDGIADALGVDDGDEGAVLWTYAQLRTWDGPEDTKYGARVALWQEETE